MRRAASLLALLIACGGSPPAKKRPPPPPKQFGAAVPIEVLAVDRNAHWAVIREDGGPPVLWVRSRREMKQVRIDGFRAANDDGQLVVVVDDMLERIDTEDRDLPRTVIGPAWLDGEPRVALIDEDGSHVIVGDRGGLDVHTIYDRHETRRVPIDDVGFVTSLTWLRGGSVEVRLDSGDDVWIFDGDDQVARRDPGPDSFWTTSGWLGFDKHGQLKLRGTVLAEDPCRDVLAVVDHPLRVAARCEDGTVMIYGEDEGLEPFVREVDFAIDEGPAPEHPFQDTVRADGLWCDQICIDLVGGHTFDALDVVWTGERYALARDDGRLLAIVLESGWRWGIPGVHLQDDDRVSASAGDVVVVGENVIDARNLKVLSRGPWEVHAVDEAGGVMVTVDGRGPLRYLEPGRFDD